jgi:hypothetical protein
MAILLVEETGGHPEKTTNLSQVLDKTLSHNVVSSTPLPEWDSNSPI